MPGRRHPRRSMEAAAAQHADKTFPGGMDGVSLLPAPVGEDAHASGTKRSPSLYFHQEEFTARGGSQDLTLTYLPLVHSEHVYMCPEGGPGGTYQEQNGAWTRDAGSKSLKVLSGMNTRPGDVVVVEYAYYEQAPAKAACGPVYPEIVFTGAPSYPNTPDGWHSYPAADGFPVIPSEPHNIVAGGNWGAYWGQTGNTQEDPESDSGFAPGSQYSRRLPFTGWATFNSNLNFYGHMEVYSGDSNARWSEASYVEFEQYYRMSGVLVPTVAYSEGDLAFCHEMSLWWCDENSLVTRSYYAIIQTPPPTSSWSLQINTKHTEPILSIPIAAAFPTNVLAPGTHHASFRLNIPERTLIAEVDGAVFAYTSDSLWHSGMSKQTMMTSTSDKSRSESRFATYVGVKFPTAGVTSVASFDGAVVRTDVPYCVW